MAEAAGVPKPVDWPGLTTKRTKENTVAYSLDGYDELERFTLALMRTGGTGCFRGTEVRCDHQLGSRAWTAHRNKITRFTADIGPGDLGYTIERLVGAGVLGAPKG